MKGTDLQAWFLGLPMIVILLVVAIVALIYYGTRYLHKREEFWCRVVEKKDAVISDLADKIIILLGEHLK